MSSASRLTGDHAATPRVRSASDPVTARTSDTRSAATATLVRDMITTLDRDHPWRRAYLERQWQREGTLPLRVEDLLMGTQVFRDVETCCASGWLAVAHVDPLTSGRRDIRQVVVERAIAGSETRQRARRLGRSA